MNWIKLIVWERERERDFQLIHTGWFHLEAFHGNKQERGHKEKQQQTPHMLTIILMQRRSSHGYKFLSVRKTERKRERERELGICFQFQGVLRLLELHVGLFATAPAAAAAAELSNNDGRVSDETRMDKCAAPSFGTFLFCSLRPTPPKWATQYFLFVENIPLRKNRANFRS